MKPFSLEEAKAGNLVCTRDGKKVRIICFDKKGGKSSIIALVDDNGFETPYNYDDTGKSLNCIPSLDIFMQSKKVTYHYAIYKDYRDILHATTFLKDKNNISFPFGYKLIEYRTIEVEE